MDDSEKLSHISPHPSDLFSNEAMDYDKMDENNNYIEPNNSNMPRLNLHETENRTM